jgi:recombinational DNA repair protein RecR
MSKNALKGRFSLKYRCFRCAQHDKKAKCRIMNDKLRNVLILNVLCKKKDPQYLAQKCQNTEGYP